MKILTIIFGLIQVVILFTTNQTVVCKRGNDVVSTGSAALTWTATPAATVGGEAS